ncbi:MAG TPA: inositol monophosphatase [Blastocatellia bacterium]|nr:inositol monophosphatase [Blastocatellia bacterium]
MSLVTYHSSLGQVMRETDINNLLGPLRKVHEQVRDAVLSSCERSALEALSRVDDDDSSGDTLYAIDRISENALIGLFESEIASIAPVVLIGEGLPDGQVVLPSGTKEDDALWRIIVDPIDGTREIMYQKRSAWVLTGVAPNRGPETNLQDIVLALQTEIPTLKQHLSDSLWAFRRSGVHAERYDRISVERRSIKLKPSTANSISHGFSMVSRFFPGAREELAAIDEEIVRNALGEVQPGKAHCFEDQYLSTGGQLYELIAGHDRFIADLRPLMEPLLNRRGLALGICCHPYDICTELIAREAGVIVTDAHGELLQVPLDVNTNVAWAGYANRDIQREIEPLLQRALAGRGL